MTTLALLGGTAAVAKPLFPYSSLGEAEANAVVEVVRSGCLSGFYGSWGDQFLGGPLVKEFEAAWCATFRVPHAVSVNSATSGLFAAMGAIGISPGDEVIVPPFTMSATVMAPLLYGGIPVFADIDPDTFCLDPCQVRAAITPRTKAILAVNLFGHPAPLAQLRALAEEHGLWLVEDNAQGPLAEEGGQLAGTIGHIGVFSLNYHKHIHTGEGGMCVTSDAMLAQRLQLIRNHGENVVEALGIEDITNLVGFNYRLTELCAAIGLEQLKRINEHVERRSHLAESLSEVARGMEGITVPVVRPHCRHVYYVWALRLNGAELGISRALFSRALAAEGFPHSVGYCRPLYYLPVFQQRRAIGRDGYPFSLSQIRYEPGRCPVAERMHAHELLMFEPCAYAVDSPTLLQLQIALRKVYDQRQQLRTQYRSAA